jgi:hypothetical protein
VCQSIEVTELVCLGLSRRVEVVVSVGPSGTRSWSSRVGVLGTGLNSMFAYDIRYCNGNYLVVCASFLVRVCSSKSEAAHDTFECTRETAVPEWQFPNDPKVWEWSLVFSLEPAAA